MATAPSISQRGCIRSDANIAGSCTAPITKNIADTANTWTSRLRPIQWMKVTPTGAEIPVAPFRIPAAAPIGIAMRLANCGPILRAGRARRMTT